MAVASRANIVQSQFFTNPKPTGNPDADENHKAAFTALQALGQQYSQDTAAPLIFSTVANPGDAVAINSVASVTVASQANAAFPFYAVGFLLSRIPVAINGIGIVQFYGLNQFLAGLIPGKRYYLSDTPGAYSLIPGTHQQAVGIALSVNTMMFFPQVIS